MQRDEEHEGHGHGASMYNRDDMEDMMDDEDTEDPR